MSGLIGLIFWAIIISKVFKALKGEQKHTGKKANRQYQTNRQYQSGGQHQVAQQHQRSQNRPVQKTTQAQRDAYYYSQQKATKERLQQKYAVQPKQSGKSDILTRAKENVQENEPDTMEQQMHAEVCRDFQATVHATSDVNAHKELSPLCDTGEESDIIKRINDLMITGYSGNLEFDRDFIAEGVDMLNRFTI